MDFERAKQYLWQADFKIPPDIVGVSAESERHIAQSLRPASILMAIMNWQGEAGLLITKRAEHLSLHPGEIAFPGGKPEPQDNNEWDTALREASEEIGLSPEQVKAVGMLNKRLTRSDFILTPCIGLIEAQPSLLINKQEVAEVFALPLCYLLKLDHWQFSWQDYRGQRCLLPHLEFQQHSVTGVTARLIVDLMNQVFNANIPIDD